MINGGNGTETGIGSVLAWQLSVCEDGTPSMGMARQHSDTTNIDAKKVNECYGAFGFFAGGPLFCGEKMAMGDDQHIIGTTKEGKAIYAGHISTDTLFHYPNNKRRDPTWIGSPLYGDAPFNFEESQINWNSINDKGFPWKTHLVFDPEKEHEHTSYGKKKGKWVWYTRIPDGGSTAPPGKPPGDGDDTEDKKGDPTPPGPQPPPKKRRSVTSPRDEVYGKEGDPTPLGGPHPDGEPEGDPKGGGSVTTSGSGTTKKKESLVGTGGQVVQVDGKYYYYKPGAEIVEVDELGYPVDPRGGGGDGSNGGTIPLSGGGTVTVGGGYYWDDGSQVGPDDLEEFKKFHEEEALEPQEKGGSGGSGSGDGSGNGYLTGPYQRAFGDVKAKGVPNSGVNSASGGLSPNLKDYRANISTNSMNTWMARAPITGIQTAFYGYSQDWRYPNYTQAPRSEGGDGKYRSGTGDGGWFIRQPESDILDLREQNATGTDPTWIHTNSSSTVWGMLPNVRFFQGYPNMSTGDIKKGYSSYIDYSTNKVTHSVREQDGTDTNFMDYPGASTDPLNVKIDLLADQDIEWKSGTNFKGALEHNNSADRTYTFQNASGTVAFTSDIPSGAGLWTLATDVVKPTTTTHHVAFNDTYLNHGVTDTNTGFKINADVFSIETGGNVNATFGSDETLTVTNKIAWKDDTSFTGTLSHANSANRDYAFPDRSENVACPDVQVFTTDGTWTKPSGVQFVCVEQWGDGGGGGGGYSAVAGSERNGGGGGGGGGYAKKIFMASELSSTETVTVGTGGAGGNGGPAGGGAGTNGGTGSGCSFGTHFTVGGGAGGIAGSATSGGDGGGGGGSRTNGFLTLGGGPSGSTASTTNPAFGGGGGATAGSSAGHGVEGGGGGGGGSTTGGAGSGGGSSIRGSGGGGSGGGVTAASPGTQSSGGAGGTFESQGIGGGGTAGSAGSGSGGNGSDHQGGGGGGGDNNGIGRPGGDGGIGGGGGGGGGGTLVAGGGGGAGGDGGSGLVIVYSW